MEFAKIGDIVYDICHKMAPACAQGNEELLWISDLEILGDQTCTI